ncbi:uncharacterized protein LOC119683545 isoform X2 [Teleopsis dalmanni]|uniref:uncharacterized protein LOC119683545 isoform X2 n=1 Tax=Teleopsis dalmanni TaxID=139649 RepID=UPI0018CFE13D|nr:uncharacterized protein LOC119683545 isoform X2 [Teleopsis dalmanni]
MLTPDPIKIHCKQLVKETRKVRKLAQMYVIHLSFCNALQSMKPLGCANRNLMSITFLALVALAAAGTSKDATAETISSTTNKPKRSLNALIGDGGLTSSFGLGSPWTNTGSRFPNGYGSALNGWNPWTSGSSKVGGNSPSPTEVANAIAAAKQASANVLIAQQQMQAAKENVLNQQRIAMEKETAAAILTQKSEAAAAVQRSEAAAAAQAVVLAQQRLAASKAAVSSMQRIAAAREAEAAAALQRSAHAAAAEIQKSEYEASKFNQYTRNGNAGAAHHLTLTKDTAFSPITAGINHVPNLETLGPWVGTNAAGGKHTTAAAWL